MVCTSLGSLLRPLFHFLCSILLIHRVLSLRHRPGFLFRGDRKTGMATIWLQGLWGDCRIFHLFCNDPAILAKPAITLMKVVVLIQCSVWFLHPLSTFSLISRKLTDELYAGRVFLWEGSGGRSSHSFHPSGGGRVSAGAAAVPLQYRRTIPGSVIK